MLLLFQCVQIILLYVQFLKGTLYIKKNSTLPGYGNITVSLIKTLEANDSINLTHIINKTFINANSLKELKISKAFPIFKKRDKEVMGSYRPISIIHTINYRTHK